jgi:non-heme chloroperoxidase
MLTPPRPSFLPTRYRGWFIIPLFLLFLSLTALAEIPQHRYFKTSDGLRLHYWEAGSGAQTLVFIPGWMMPAQVFSQQLQTLSKQYRVIAFDPRSQGLSEVSQGSHAPQIRNRDLRELLDHVHPGPFLLAGWSLGVLEILDFLARNTPKNLAGIVLIDNSIGFGPAPSHRSTPAVSNSPQERAQRLRSFVKSLTKKTLPPSLFEAIYQSTLQISEPVARQLVQKPYEREYWRSALLKQKVPVLYAIRPQYEIQGREFQAERPQLASLAIFPKAGHALFLDDPARFNQSVLQFAQKSFRKSVPPTN